MLLRAGPEGVLAIAQPGHAWVSGQLARAWGNARFGALRPCEAVCLAAEQHDVGMGAWDMAPTLNRETGLPYAFTEMPIDLHLAQWRDGPRRVAAQNRYSGLLVSMHGTRLYERRDLSALPEADAGRVRAHLAEQRALQARLRASLRADPLTAGDATPEGIARNSQLLWTWDFLSLALCLDWAPCTAREVPTADGAVDLELELAPSPGGALTVTPWPFRAGGLTVRYEARRLTERFADEGAMRDALETAPWQTHTVALLPG